MCRMAKGEHGMPFLICGLCWSALFFNAQPFFTLAATNLAPTLSIQLPAPVADPFTANPALLNSRSNAPLKEIQPGIFHLADVKIDKRQRTVSFPAVMNLRQGAMEYFLVTSWGKVHESILRTDTEPFRIHVAMLLLGAKDAG